MQQIIKKNVIHNHIVEIVNMFDSLHIPLVNYVYLRTISDAL